VKKTKHVTPIDETSLIVLFNRKYGVVEFDLVIADGRRIRINGRPTIPRVDNIDAENRSFVCRLLAIREDVYRVNLDVLG
jgi:hypothetical protein